RVLPIFCTRPTSRKFATFCWRKAQRSCRTTRAFRSTTSRPPASGGCVPSVTTLVRSVSLPDDIKASSATSSAVPDPSTSEGVTDGPCASPICCSPKKLNKGHGADREVSYQNCLAGTPFGTLTLYAFP